MQRIGIVKRSHIAAIAALALAWFAGDTFADTVTLAPSKDATLIENTAGNLANGSGPALFAGRNASSTQSLRRALLAFDVAAAVPPGSTIVSARLSLNVSAANPGTADMSLFHVVEDWGEGASSSSGGGGAPAFPGDATWLHRVYDQTLWFHPGGDFVPAPSAVVVVDQAGPYIWGPTAVMTADVQSWLDHPGSAFGWILIGDETRPQTARRFDSRESPDATTRPALEIEFVPPCVPLPLGPGDWRHECDDRASIAPVLDCAARHLGDLGLPGVDPCDDLTSRAPRDCDARALEALSLVVLNLCSGRLQTSCPVPDANGVCGGDTLGDRLQEAATLAGAGDCRRAFACLAGANGP
jgi:hypothetical protein